MGFAPEQALSGFVSKLAITVAPLVSWIQLHSSVQTTIPRSTAGQQRPHAVDKNHRRRAVGGAPSSQHSTDLMVRSSQQFEQILNTHVCLTDNSPQRSTIELFVVRHNKLSKRIVPAKDDMTPLCRRTEKPIFSNARTHSPPIFAVV
jgi:hypothetical protein